VAAFAFLRARIRSCVRKIGNAQAVVLAIGASPPENSAMLFDLAAQYARPRSMPAHFSPAVDHPGGCFCCRYFGHRVDVAVWCVRPRSEHVRSQADRGCAFWEREPGSDDE